MPTARSSRQSKTAQAVKALNRSHRAVVLRFRGNGTGRCVCWETIAVLTRICSSVPIKLNREHSQAGWTETERYNRKLTGRQKVDLARGTPALN